jgi:hypothetical protein
MIHSPSAELAAVGVTDSAYAECYVGRPFVSMSMRSMRFKRLSNFGPAKAADDETRKNIYVQLD